MSKHIGLFVTAGLGNRIRVINSLLNLLEDSGVTDYKVTAYWVVADELNARFEDLFEPIDKVRVVNVPKASLRFLWLKAWYKAAAYNDVRDSSTIDVGTPKTIYIHTVHEFHPINKNFVFFNRHIHERTDVPAQRYVGIHIRQGDNRQSIEHSPLGMFEDKIREILLEEPSTLFYLSTDAADVRQQFHERFGDRIVVSRIPKLDRHTLEGIQGAASDMIILSRSEKIFGSFYSSFSEVAARFHNIPLIILKK
ncbi:O-fucosyltransferase family protein [Dinghuibacter silviterrae]|uniref:Glycosyl transferase family 11 n=1 Tax=Dinghuibacter silviterrae TaxID=1539049 RepID=A0A4V3GM21_9BACT|nr:hypothetical protein [Dinghuibacter silviterrae]TDX01773.1 hypothetical protein EDB95_2816 [Dinghuibacter silviterrae]